VSLSAPKIANCPSIAHAVRELENWSKRAQLARLDLRRFGALLCNTDLAHVSLIVAPRSWLVREYPEILWPESEAHELQVYVSENSRAQILPLAELTAFVANEKRKAG
jgi:hypothetical protein